MIKEIKVYSFEELERDVQLKVIENNKDRILTIINNYVTSEWWNMMCNLKVRMELNFPWVIMPVKDDNGDVLGAGLEMDLSDCPGWMFMTGADSYEYIKGVPDNISTDGIWQMYRNMCVNARRGTSLIVFIRTFLLNCVNDLTDWVLKMRFDNDYAVDYLLGRDDEKFVKVEKFFGDRMFTSFGEAIRVAHNEDE